jgi:LysM repeat protein
MNFRTTTAAVRTAATTRNRVRAVLVTGALAAIPVAGLVTATGASAATPSTWDAVASCESTNNWSANTGNGFYGGLQFTPSTWAAYGGTQYAASADQASESQQIAVAENVLASQGPGAWPVCGPQAGLTAGGASAASTSPSGTDNGTSSTSSSDNSTSDNTGSSTAGTSSSSSTSSSASTSNNASTSTGGSEGGGGYTVRSGDTLSSIAASHGTDWEALYSANRSTIGADANVIYPGQTLTIG